mmetsp:Transcript_32049/g.73726  ORF Transcript_32049/g.73726 Transcript_32049/m.73726 type:complete len:1237 (-) Transcript_32049:124-3834(-)|eukprot:CAMPEP_0113310018 /NCGR_PEP_ID=MMETSP0010_2-20120614/7827_1 /TAXON_ID=216773 ORGANISM="Corethron hystrix, Strain 308" /NCGR_SAMPLE_ID=MMETSP0010_2 /ASSEMBLY_ACC=CAM_ASM_000155 /LENGTH=1236 /DNA_ID=CAMNT_0000165381 /DNA_START=154 /DNA_END=3864 /DNA_ORIENTATION=+ /assembly_acc=CAM_ASM_000155
MLASRALIFIASSLLQAQSNGEGSCDDTTPQQKIIQWTVSNGGYFSSKQEFRRAIPGDPSSIFGIFAKEDIKKGELLTSVPWKCIIHSPFEVLDRGYTTDKNEYFDCTSTSFLIDEMKKGNTSFFEPYITYMLDQPRGKIPSDWSDAGKNLLEMVIGYDMLPPQDAVGLVDVWKKLCHVEGNDPLETQMMVEYYARCDDNILVPVYDLYNHANGYRKNGIYTTTWGIKQDFFAFRDIQKGEEINHSYSQNDNQDEDTQENYDTPQFLRDYGFVEPFPQRWSFDEGKVRFDLNVSDDVSQVTWRGEKPDFESVKFMQEQLWRLLDKVEPRLEAIEEIVENQEHEGNTVPPPSEVATIRQYFDALYNALEAAVDIFILENGDPSEHEHDIFPYSDIYTPVEGSRTPFNHESFRSYNLQINNPKWRHIEFDESEYQQIMWVGDPEKNDACFLLNEEPQTSSSFRAHYHDIAAHFPTRYFDSIRRVAILGGGDSLMLQEMMKYDTIEKVVHLELDQMVTRKSHKYFASQPLFHDDRVEWWFGNAARSLLMLPSDYFGSFDIVFVDLSESGFMSETVTHDLTVWDMMSQLVAPEGILVKNEIYHETTSELFDNTLLIYYEHVPIVKSWALSIGSNRKDLLQPNVTSMSKWKNIKTVWEGFKPTAENFDDHFKYAHDYSINDARDQGVCPESSDEGEDENESEDDEVNSWSAGILLIIEAEKTTETIELDTISIALKEIGLTPLSTISRSPGDDKGLGLIFLKEGVVTVRTWSEEKYCAFDVQLWSMFDKIESVKTSLSKIAGSHNDHVSSYRIITAGIQGTETQIDDNEKMGPTGKSSRQCDEPKDEDINIDDQVIESVIEGSLDMIQEKSGLVVVLCGNSNEPCLSNNVLKKKDSITTLSLWTCPSILSAESESSEEEEDEFAEKLSMFSCEMELLDKIRDAVSKDGKLLAFVLDSSAKVDVGILADRIWKSPRNKSLLLADQFTFIAPSTDQLEEELDEELLWRKNWLEWRRRELVDYEYLFRAEVKLQSSKGSLEVGLLSGQDPLFFSRLVNVTKTIEAQTGIRTRIMEIEGGIEEFSEYQEETWYTEDDFAADRKAGEAQFALQRPLAEQRLVQFVVKDGKVSTFVLKAIFDEIVLTHTEAEMQDFEDIGNGYVVGAVSTEGSIVLIWDGMKQIDVNVFGYSTDTSILWQKIKENALKYRLNLDMSSYDEFPRGVERVINLRKDLEVWRNLSEQKGR